MNSTGLLLFQHLCELGNTLERARDLHVPWSDDWAMLTDIVQRLDAAVDLLVYSSGLGGDDDG